MRLGPAEPRLDFLLQLGDLRRGAITHPLVIFNREDANGKRTGTGGYGDGAGCRAAYLGLLLLRAPDDARVELGLRGLRLLLGRVRPDGLPRQVLAASRAPA